MIHGLKLYLAIIIILGQTSCADIVSRTQRIIQKGIIRYHYDDDNVTSSAAAACSTVMLIGVGTAMGVGDYDTLSHELVKNSSIVIVMMDHNPLWLRKTDAKKFADLSDTIVSDLETLVPVCNESSSVSSSIPRNGFVIGGHSASGQAAIEALGRNLFSNFKPIGLFGLDPYDATVANDFTIDIPALYWGFAKTTCDVNITKAAEYAYDHTSSPKRVFYQVDNNATNGGCGITHCIFTDHGCGGPGGDLVVCPSHSSDGWVRPIVGDTARRFAAALESEDFSRSNFVLNDNTASNMTSKNPIHLFVGRERPNRKPTDPIMLHAALS